MVFITVKGIDIEANVINHPHCSITIAQVLALGPQYRLIKNIWIVRYQLDRMSSTNGVLDGLTSGLIDQSKAGKALFILHSYAVLFIFDPVLAWVGRIRRGKNDFSFADCEGVIGLGLGANPNSFDSSRFTGVLVMVLVDE